MFTLVRTTAPAETPISLTEVKQHLRVEHNDDNSLLEALIAVATTHFDGWDGILSRALVTQTWQVAWSRFMPDGRFWLPLQPVQEIKAISYWDIAGAEQAVTPADYSLQTSVRGTEIVRRAGFAWPAVSRRVDAVRVSFVAGYGAAKDVPAAIKQAMKLHVQANYDDVDQDQFRQRIEDLVRPYRPVRV